MRVGGAFQGGKTPDPSKPYHGSFVGRWDLRSDLDSTDEVRRDRRHYSRNDHSVADRQHDQGL